MPGESKVRLETGPDGRCQAIPKTRSRHISSDTVLTTRDYLAPTRDIWDSNWRTKYSNLDRKVAGARPPQRSKLEGSNWGVFEGVQSCFAHPTDIGREYVRSVGNITLGYSV